MEQDKSMDKKKTIIFFFLAIIVFIIIISLATKEPAKQKREEPQKAEEVKGSKDYTFAFKLASIQERRLDPPEGLVSSFEGLLADLDRKCPELNEEEVSDLILRTKVSLEEKGNQETLLEIGKSISKSIPEEAIGLTECREIGTMLITITD